MQQRLSGSLEPQPGVFFILFKTSAARDIEAYWIAPFIAVGTIVLIYFLLRARQGLALSAIRDAEPAAASLGVKNFWTKFWVFIVAAFGTGMTGAVIYFQKAGISPDAGFSVIDWTAFVVFIVVIGGIGTIEGPIIGVIIFFILQNYLADFGTWYLMLLVAIATVVMLVSPQGVWGWVVHKYDLQLFPVQRRLVVEEDEKKAPEPAE